MRTRDVTIPLGLWICAAICAHFFLGTGGLVVAKVHDDRSELWKLAREARSLTEQSEQTFEVSLSEPSEEAPVRPPPANRKPPALPKAPAVAPKPEAPKRPPEKPREVKTRAVALQKKVKVEEKKKPIVPPNLAPDRRIAVVQHAKPDQDDNPTAKYIADEANRVKEETKATQTSHDRDDDKPSPSATHAGSDKNPGDSEKNRIAESGEHAGEKNRAPGERGTDSDVQREPKLPKAESLSTPTVVLQNPSTSPAPVRTAANDSRPPSPRTPSESEPRPVAGGATPASPEVEETPSGSWTFNPARQGGPSAAATEEPTAGEAASLPGGRLWSLPGLGQNAAPGALNTNLNQAQIAFVVGSDNLRRLREADGQRRRSEHRGSWTASNFDRWRSAIENYVSSVRPGNQTALNTARVPFASYLNGMHNRIHPIFAESFLESLDALPANHPLNDQHLVTMLEIVLTRDGHLKKMGVVRTSGITAFDVAALDAVDRAQPFGPAPSVIVSPDGNVYLHWEFHRDEVYACSTMGARPFILSGPAPGNETPRQLPPVPPPGPVKEEPGTPAATPNDAREGAVPPHRFERSPPPRPFAPPQSGDS